jgi:hypothetical protein
MPRSRASEADKQLIADAVRHGDEVTARQLERWRAGGLLAPNVRRALGRGRGSRSEPPPGSVELVVWLAQNAGRGRRPADLALLAFAAGLAVPETTVRDAFTEAVNRLKLPGEDGVASGSEPEDFADAAVAAGLRFTVVPARMRRIDRDLSRMGVNWSVPKLAALDPGLSESRATESDWVFNAVQLMISGGSGIDMGTIGSLIRTLAPVGGVAPLAGQIEYGLPIGRGDGPSGLPDDSEVLQSLLTGGDWRDQARDLAITTPTAEMLDAYKLAAGLPGWAEETCAAVEREIGAGELGEAAKEWALSAALGGGLTRLLLTVALRDKTTGPVGTAMTALVLIFIRNKIRALRRLLPAENFEVLNNPLLAPAFLLDFLDR